MGIGGVFFLGWILNDYWFCNLRPLSFSSTFNTSPLNSGIHLDNINSAGQPVLDLHSALNNIHKSFSLGSGNRSRLNHNRSNFSNSLQVFELWIRKLWSKNRDILLRIAPCFVFLAGSVYWRKWGIQFHLVSESPTPLSPTQFVDLDFPSNES